MATKLEKYKDAERKAYKDFEIESTDIEIASSIKYKRANATLKAALKAAHRDFENPIKAEGK